MCATSPALLMKNSSVGSNRSGKARYQCSRLVGETLRDHMMNEEDYERAHRSYTRRSATLLKAEGASYPTRDEIHCR